jgi:hydrophobic/amphiphilic exporter-1 (mainly G- bacteria), HAE1 family
MDSPAREATKEPPRRLAIRRPVTMAMLFLTLAVFGWRSFQQLPVNLMPDISYPALTVRTEYEGAAPEDVEKLVTRPLEELLSVSSGLEEISSVSSPGLSEIILEFTWDTDMNRAQQDVRDRIDLFEAPREITERPVILRYDPALDPIIRIALSPEDGTHTPEERQKTLTAIRDNTERRLKSDLEAQKGIAQIEISGGREEEIQVLVDAHHLKSLGLSLEHIVHALARENINISGGQLHEGRTVYLVRTLNEFPDIAAIGECVLTAPDGRLVRLSEVADVFSGAKDRETIVHVNGREAVAIAIYKEGGANTVEVCNTVKDLLAIDREPGMMEIIRQAVAEARRQAGNAPGGGTPAAPVPAPAKNLLDRLPEHTDSTVISDQSRFILGAVREVQAAVLAGGLLALAVLFLFLREMRSTLIIGFAIPISVVAAFIPMFLRGISLNIMSLGGLALGVGMLVDNAIVVLESIFRCREEGDDPVAAADRGTGEVQRAVTASTFTTISVFLPVAFVEGVAGQLFGDLALTVTFSLLASLLAALYLIPLIASRRGLALERGREAVWIARAWRESREAGAAPLHSLIAIVPRGIGYARAYLKTSASGMFGPPLRALRPVRFRRIFHLAGALLALLLLAPLFLIQIWLRLLAAIAVTGLFFAGLVIAGGFLAVRFVLRILFWLPLTIFEYSFNLFRDGYTVLLKHSLRLSAVILLLVLGIAAHAGYTALGLGRELLPPLKQGEFGIHLEARPGTQLEETAARARRIEAILRSDPRIGAVTVEIGEEQRSAGQERGENSADFTVILENPDRNARHQDRIIADLRHRITALPDESITFTLPALFSFNNRLELRIYGDDLDTLAELGRRSLTRLEKVPGLADLDLSLKPGYPEIIVALDRERLASRNLTVEHVARILKTEVQGEEPTRFNRRGEKVPVRVRTDQRLLSSISDLRRLAVSEGPQPVPLSDIADIRQAAGPSEIRRVDQQRAAIISAGVEGRDTGSAARAMMAAVRNLERPGGYWFEAGGQSRELETSWESLRLALLLALFLVYAVMACQFESIVHPALVMFSAPLALIGVIYALAWTGTTVSIMVFLGGIVLAGIVVNDAIVLVDYINQLRARGMNRPDAIVEAGRVRLRPILMTTVTTLLGLLPMIIASGEGTEMRRPMAITVMAGLTSATLLTLFIVPMAYRLFGGRDRP